MGGVGSLHRTKFAVAVLVSEMKRANIWFLIGLLQTTYGLIILVAGIRQLSHPPATTLANLHATLWAGIAILLMGVIFVVTNNPRTSRANGTVHRLRRFASYLKSRL
jgi:hypothetical protein